MGLEQEGEREGGCLCDKYSPCAPLFHSQEKPWNPEHFCTFLFTVCQVALGMKGAEGLGHRQVTRPQSVVTVGLLGHSWTVY